LSEVAWSRTKRFVAGANGMNGPRHPVRISGMRRLTHRPTESKCQIGRIIRIPSRRTGMTIMEHTIVGVDIAKNVMQVHWVDPDSGEIVKKPVKRAVFLEYFANRPPCLIGMESCGGSQHWARRLIEWVIR
jgi:hypothetical protein